MAEKEKTAPCVPTAIGTEQPLQMDCTNSITENSADFNSSEDNFELMMKRMLDPTYLPTISMTELYNNIYDKKQPLIDVCFTQEFICSWARPRSERAFSCSSSPIT